MITGDEIAEKIKAAMLSKGHNMRSLADAANLNPTGVRDIILRKVRDPKYDTIARIAETLGITVHELLYGESVTNSLPADSFVSIARYDAKLAAGTGYFNPDHVEVLDYIPFTRDFIQHKLGRKTTNGLMCCDARGDSMEPVIEDGDLLIVDRASKERPAGIYAVNYDGESYVKRVEKIGSGYSLVSENRAYSPITIKEEDLNQLDIIGKVVWAGRVF